MNFRQTIGGRGRQSKFFLSLGRPTHRPTVLFGDNLLITGGGRRVGRPSVRPSVRPTYLRSHLHEHCCFDSGETQSAAAPPLSKVYNMHGIRVPVESAKWLDETEHFTPFRRYSTYVVQRSSSHMIEPQLCALALINSEAQCRSINGEKLSACFRTSRRSRGNRFRQQVKTRGLRGGNSH